MKLLPFVGVLVAVLAAVVLVCLAALWLGKRFPSKSYDERQKLARGRAGSLSMAVGVAYYFVVTLVLLWQVEGSKTVEPYLLVAGGLLLMAMVDHTYCLLCHAALPLSQKAGYTIVCYFLMGAMHVWRSVADAARITISLVGKSTSLLFSLMLGIGFLYLSLMHAIALLRDRKEANE